MNLKQKNIKRLLIHKKTVLLLAIAAAIVLMGTASTQAQWPRIAVSKDGTPISYEIYGNGEPALVFVHGWSCDARYWRNQIGYFAKSHQVVALDLAGHGHSGKGRSEYTMKAFGLDVKAVVDAAGGSKVILIGHSMGGSVIAEAARLMPKQVIGLIGVDTLENIEYPLTREQSDQAMAPLRENFTGSCRQFVTEMIYPGTDPKLKEWILSDMTAAPETIALSAMKYFRDQYVTGEAATIFEAIQVPVVVVNGDLWPINYDANRRHMFSFDAIVLKGADHFLMMNKSKEFNMALEKAIEMITTKQK
ncbi:MAG: alpha/beta hydrolase [Desulfobacteraceae bacterium]|nr:alpha/beta hydrolase [Desulfobacteraceae bacterium]